MTADRAPSSGLPPSGSRLHGRPLAVELRQVLDRLSEAVEGASDITATVEDAFGLEYRGQGTAPDEVEQVKAAIDMPVVLGELRALAGQVCRNADALQVLLFRLGKAAEGLALEKAAKLERSGKA
jgi:hypothetical protein